ncbi:MAG: hypothetical protein QMC80_05495 [Thermoplasmatales archaeon]|nr:hypothetical protein [Thermoplasmatales archaeon]
MFCLVGLAVLILPAILAMVLIPKILTGGWGYTTRLGLWFFFGGLLVLGIPRFIPNSAVVCGTVFFAVILIFVGIVILFYGRKERKSKEGFLTTGAGLFLIMICTIVSLISRPFYASDAGYSSPVSYFTSIFFLIGVLGIVSNREEVSGAHQMCACAAGVLYIINFLLIYYAPLFIVAMGAGAIFSGASVTSSTETMFSYAVGITALVGFLSVLCPTLLVFGLEDKKGKIILSSAFFTGLAGIFCVVKIFGDVLNLSTKDVASAVYSHPLAGTYFILNAVSGVLFCTAFVLAWRRYTYYIPVGRYTSVIEKEGSESRVIKADVPKSLTEIYMEKQKKLGVAPEPKLSKPLLLRCKRCGEIIRITEGRRPLKIRCPKCGGEGILQ